MIERKPYPTDLTDEQWAKIEPLLSKRDGRGRKPVHTRREMFNAMLYLNRTGCQWRMLPHDFPAWEAVYAFWRRLVERNAWLAINDALRMEIRLQEERESEPSVVIVDSQSVQTAEKRGRLGLILTSERKASNDKSP
jgi:putative transposase